MGPFFVIGFLQVGFLWIGTGVSLLWLCRRIDPPAAIRLLTPVTLALAICSLVILYSYGMELFVAHYSGSIYEMDALQFRLTGPYAWAYGIHLAALMAPLAFFVPAVRRSMPVVTGICLACFAAAHSGAFVKMLAFPAAAP